MPKEKRARMSFIGTPDGGKLPAHLLLEAQRQSIDWATNCLRQGKFPFIIEGPSTMLEIEEKLSDIKSKTAGNHFEIRMWSSGYKKFSDEVKKMLPIDMQPKGMLQVTTYLGLPVIVDEAIPYEIMLVEVKGGVGMTENKEEGELRRRIRNITEVTCNICKMQFESIKDFDNHWSDEHLLNFGNHSNQNVAVGFREVAKVEKILDEATHDFPVKAHYKRTRT